MNATQDWTLILMVVAHLVAWAVLSARPRRAPRPRDDAANFPRS